MGETWINLVANMDDAVKEKKQDHFQWTIGMDGMSLLILYCGVWWCVTDCES